MGIGEIVSVLLECGMGDELGELGVCIRECVL